MLGEHFQNPEGGISVEPGIMEMLQRMESGRFKVFGHLNDWFEEMRIYHRVDGKIIKKHDDLMASTRYAVQSIRYARTLSFEPRARFAEGSYNWKPFAQEFEMEGLPA